MMFRDVRAPYRGVQYRHTLQQSLDEFEAILESDFLSYIPPSVISSMKRVIARKRGNSALHD